MCTFDMDRKSRIRITKQTVCDNLLNRLKVVGHLPHDQLLLGEVMETLVETIVEGIMDELV